MVSVPFADAALRIAWACLSCRHCLAGVDDRAVVFGLGTVDGDEFDRQVLPCCIIADLSVAALWVVLYAVGEEVAGEMRSICPRRGR